LAVSRAAVPREGWV
jgi:hypothetical protein